MTDKIDDIRMRVANFPNPTDTENWRSGYLEFASHAHQDMMTLLDEIDRLHDICKREAYDAGYSDALFDGIQGEPLHPCQCACCVSEYQRGWTAGELALDAEMEDDE